MQRVSKRLLALKRGNFWEMLDQLVRKHEPVNLGKGFPNWPPPAFMVPAATKAMTELDLNQYTAMFGFPPLTQEIAKLYSEELGTPVNAASDVLVSVGALGSLFCAFQAFLDPGDQVLVVEPFFNLYSAQVQFSGAEFIGMPLHYSKNSTGVQSSSQFTLDLDEAEKLVTPNTKMMVINSPHNPSGKVFDANEMESICNFVKKHDLLLVSDEVYERMTFSKDLPHIHPASYPGMFERTITIGSAGKTFSVTGWKIGWSIGPMNLIGPMKRVHLMSAASINCPGQYAVLQGFKEASASNYFTELSDTLRENRNKLTAAFQKVGLDPIVPDGSYMMLVDFSSLKLPEESQHFSSEDSLNWKLCKELIGTHKLATIPLEPFYTAPNQHLAGGLLRICFCKTPDTISQAVEKILALTPHISNE